MRACVLDTSVIFKWFSPDEESDRAAAFRLRRGFLDGTLTITVPDLLFFELANALRYAPRVSAADARNAIHAVFHLEFDVRPITADLATSAVDLAHERGATVYDASFLALANAERKTLITADEKFYQCVKNAGNILRLSDLPPERAGRRR